MQNGLLRPYTGSRIFEGTVGSTGISIATIARARGYDATIIMPDDVAEEKVKALLALGAEVERVRPASIVDKKQNLARQRASRFAQEDLAGSSSLTPGSHSRTLQSTPSSVVVTTTADVDLNHSGWQANEDFLTKPRGYFADQFENKANFDAHFNGTGPEIWRQTSGRVHAFVSGAGTGGTVAGAGYYLKSVNPDIIVAIADPEGSGLYNKVEYGVMYDRREAEGTRRRHQVDTVVEGIGINRLTNNIESALSVIDNAFRYDQSPVLAAWALICLSITDEEAVAMSRYLVKNDGLFLGSSSACNLMACVKLVKKWRWKDGQHIVTILMSKLRHSLRLIVDAILGTGTIPRNDDYLRNANIPINLSLVEDLLEPIDD
ncbi:hypothetical protein D9756_007647 [Leucocoprinus leucothites]|uniref:Tryptophan synthase beta chain-like PALP domain-containing protein n=1 Tax=Leucocoprinus leucothites TaxID=201217 RepID=A0A8H5FW33_9AGAR|nr:hypothetical protein D9756_007647 [Leucoagaricus leucothites]